MMEGFRKILAHMGIWIDDLLYPEAVACLCCDHALGADDQDCLCPDCRKALDQLARRQEACEAKEHLPLPEGISALHAAFVYEGPARRLVHLLKYESIRAAAVPLARQMAYLPSGEEEIIVPVPTDPRRERRRGFNQSTLLARHIAGELGMQMETALVRVESRHPQTGLSAGERMENLVGCMKACDAVNGKRVLLIDDVVTTGATIREASRALQAAGAKSVCVFAAARAARNPDGEKDPFELPQRR